MEEGSKGMDYFPGGVDRSLAELTHPVDATLDHPLYRRR